MVTLLVFTCLAVEIQLPDELLDFRALLSMNLNKPLFLVVCVPYLQGAPTEIDIPDVVILDLRK